MGEAGAGRGGCARSVAKPLTANLRISATFKFPTNREMSRQRPPVDKALTLRYSAKVLAFQSVV